MSPGRVRREDHHYERQGVRAVFLFFDPLRGWREQMDAVLLQALVTNPGRRGKWQASVPLVAWETPRCRQ